MNPRQPDGTFRGPKQPTKLSDASIRARWIEAESLALKKAWVSYEDIATHVARVASGDEKPVKPLPEGLIFEPAFKISRQAIQKTVTKALGREPATNVEEFRQLATAQCEDSLKYLQPAIRKGDPQAISTSTKVMGMLAKFYCADGADKSSAAAKRTAAKPPLVELLQAIGLGDDGEEKAA